MRLFLKVLFILLGVAYGHNVNAAAASEGEVGFDAEGRRIARVRILRGAGLTPEQISAVVDEGKCLPGKNRALSKSVVYHRLYTEYCLRIDSPESRISRLLNLAKLIHDDNFDPPFRFFNSKVSLYTYVCREAGIWTEKTDTRRRFKSQLSLRAAHLHMGIWHETGKHQHLEDAYNLFGQAYKITRNKYGLPMMAEIIMDHGFLAGHTTREEALIEAGRLLSIFLEPRSTLPAVAPGERAKPARDAGRITSEQLRMGLSQYLAEELKARIAGAMGGEGEDAGSISSSSPAAVAMAVPASPLPASAGWGHAHAGLTSSSSSYPAAAMATMGDVEEEEEEEEDNYGIMGPLSAPAASAVAAQLPAPGGWGSPAGLTSSSSTSAAAAAVAVPSVPGVSPESMEEEEYGMDPLPAPVGWGHSHAGSTSSSSSSAAAAVAAAAAVPAPSDVEEEEDDDDDAIYLGRRRFPVAADPVGLSAAADESDDDESLYRGNRRFPVAAEPGGFDEETRTEFNRIVQLVRRWKTLYPAKTNNEISTDLDLSRALVTQALS